ncbi:MAG: hypothetical protein IJK04_10110, partial [Kiritimatiellae bacterium]|nr:hypothetical protein [Kiritimatiellia bacterium]
VLYKKIAVEVNRGASCLRTNLPRKPPRNPHTCQCIRIADDLWSGDMRKVPRELPLAIDEA